MLKMFKMSSAGIDTRQVMDSHAIMDYYDSMAFLLDSYHNKNAYYYELLGDLLQFLIPGGKRVLDLGCGTGDLLNTLNPSYGVGIDISSRIIDIAKTRYPHLQFSAGDIQELNICEEPFDYILISNTIGYIQDIQKFISQLKPYVKPETRIVFTYYNFLWEPLLKLTERLGMKMKEPFLNWLSPGDLDNFLNLEGFEVIKRRRGVLIPKRLPCLSYFINRYISPLPFFHRLSLIEAVVAAPIFFLSDSRSLRCSVIVPARNEKGNIEAIVRRTPVMGQHTEIIFIEGHSHDGTFEEITRVAAANPGKDIKALRQEGDGKCDAVCKGFDNAGGDVVMILDADLTVRPEELPKFYNAIVSGKAGLAIGSRLVYPVEKESMRFLNLVGNKLFSMAFSYLIGQRIKDTLCGTKALKRDDYRLISKNRDYFGDLDPFGDFDLIFGAAKTNLKIVEIPVRYQARKYGVTQIKRFYHGFLLLKMVCIAMKKLKFI